MTENNNYIKSYDNELDIKEFISVLLGGKKIIISITSSLFILGALYSFFLPNIYESETLLAPIEESSSLRSGALSELSGLAGLAGITLPTSDNSSNSRKAIEMMRSISFFETHIMPKIYLPDLMAIEYWNAKENLIIYDESIFEKSSDTWVRNYSFPQKLIPSAQESHLVFMEDHFDLTEDKDTGYVVLSVKHQSPTIAKEWAETIVNEVNNYYRQKDKSGSEKAVTYLKQQLAKTNLSEIKQVTSSLIQREMQKLTLIEANPNYVFEYIYPPEVMEERSEPYRALIIVLFTLFGGILSFFVVLSRHYFSEENIG